jgi:hypothetical protein
MFDAAVSDHAAIHRVLIDHIRQGVAANCPALAAKFAILTDDALVRMMFANYRGHPPVRGLRLTQFGLVLMERHFRGCEIMLPADETYRPCDLLYLDNKATMPYYCGGERFVLYDYRLGIKLMLAGGRIGILIEIEGGR